MQTASVKRFFVVLVIWGALAAAASAQQANSISGFIFGADRRPVGEANVELMDEFSRTINRMRTNANGRCTFSRLSSGRYKVRVFSVGDYEDQEQEIEIQNFRATDSSGAVRTSGFENAQRDFYLKPRKTAGAAGKPAVVFAQKVPENARAKYETAIKDLDGGRQAEGVAGLKEAVELYPDYFDALDRLGTEYIKLKHYRPAALLFLKALEFNNRSFSSWYGLSYAYNSLSGVPEALAAAEKALEVNPRSVEATLLKGTLQRKLTKFGDAEKTLLKAKELSGGNVPEVHWHLGLLYGMDLKKYREAVDEFEQYLRLAPNVKNKDQVRTMIDELKKKA